jgi:hypothetical protein
VPTTDAWQPVTLASTRLREDVTSPRVRAALLGKFKAAKAHHQTHQSLILDPMSGISSALAGGKDAKGGSKKPLTAAQKAAIAAKMKALRKQILGDFSSMTKFGKRVDCSYPYPAASCKVGRTSRSLINSCVAASLAAPLCDRHAADVIYTGERGDVATAGCRSCGAGDSHGLRQGAIGLVWQANAPEAAALALQVHL